MSRKSSHARGIGAMGASSSRRSLLNRSQDEIYHMYDEELINPDEFEEIAEIYDSIRVLHSKVNPSIDSNLAADFDSKLREVMEALS